MFGPDCNLCGGYIPGNPGAYSAVGKWCHYTEKDRKEVTQKPAHKKP